MTFEIDGKCLCYHGPLLYEARILRIYNPETKTYQDKQNEQVAITEEDNFPQDSANKRLWFIHYQGWKSTWDEWVGEERIRPYNEENLALKKQLVRDVKEAAANAKRAKSKGSSVSSSSGAAVSGKPEKSPSLRGRSAQSQAHQNQTQQSPHAQQPQQQASQQPQNDHQPTTPKITVRMPLVLRSLLVDDWEYITKERKLLQLPCSPNVQEILHAYYKYRASQLASPVAQTLLHEFVEGIRLYFDQCLSHLLLYRLERLQFDEVCASAMPQGSEGSLEQAEPLPSAVYGGTHLIRLISLMPELIVGTTMDEKNCHTVVSQCEALLAWISTRIGLVIPNKYVNTSAQYEGIALGM